MNIGIIGTGKHGSRYARHIVQDCHELRLTAIARRSESGREQAQRWRCRYYPEWRELLEDPAVDAVIAAVPPVLNPDIAQRCAELGKPVLLEKPLAVDAAAAAGISRLTETGNLLVTVGQTLRYNPVIRALREELNRDGRGRLFCCYANQRLEPATLSWLDDPEIAGAGVLLHVAVHVFDALHYITGRRIVRVSADSWKLLGRRVEDSALIRFELEGAVIGQIDVSKLGPGRSGRYEFVCSTGHLVGDQVHGTVGFVSPQGRERLGTFEPTPTIVPFLADWRRYLAGNGPNPVPVEAGCAAVRVCDACRVSSDRGGQWVDVPGRDNDTL